MYVGLSLGFLQLHNELMIFFVKAFVKPVMKGHIPYDSIYMNRARIGKSRDRKWVSGRQGLGRKRDC